jgi:MFS family permease
MSRRFFFFFLAMTQSPHPFPSASSLFHKIAIPFLFVLLGVIYASWAARIPAIRAALLLTPGQLGLVLLAGGVGAAGSFPIAAGAVAHLGARHAAWHAGTALLLFLPCVAFAPGLWWLMSAALALGAAIGCFDVAINALGAENEKAAGRSIMSLLHAWFCLGAMCGALFGSAMAGIGMTPWLHYCIVSLLLAPPLFIAYRVIPQDRPTPGSVEKYFAIAHGPVVALGIIGFCGAVAEGSIADWSGVFMKDQLGVSDGIAPLAYASFACLMFGARLLCDRLKDRHGARLVVACGAAFASCGLLIAVFAVNVPLTIAGFACAGAGLAAVFPFVFSAAGRHGAASLAAVATFSYSGGLLGPPVIGFLAQAWGMRAGLGFVVAIALAIAVAASRAKWLE